MFFVESWRESAMMMTPKRAKLLLLVTAKCLRDLFDRPLMYIIVIPFVIATSISMVYAKEMKLDFYSFFISAVTNGFMALLLIMVRPSVMLKHRYYFMHYWLHLLYIIVGFGAIDAFRVHHPALWPLWIWFIWAPLAAFWLLFFLDSCATPLSFIHSLLRAVLMLFYNLPLCAVISVGWYLVFIAFSRLPIWLLARSLSMPQASLLVASSSIVGFLLFPLWYVLLTNIYIKQLHEQFSLYFGKPLS